jgi:hypothetical protein
MTLSLSKTKHFAKETQCDDVEETNKLATES